MKNDCIVGNMILKPCPFTVLKVLQVFQFSIKQIAFRHLLASTFIDGFPSQRIFSVKRGGGGGTVLWTEDNFAFGQI